MGEIRNGWFPTRDEINVQNPATEKRELEVRSHS